MQGEGMDSGIEKFKEYGNIRRIHCRRFIDTAFQIAHDDEQKPAESQAHVHKTQKQVFPEYFPVQQAFEHYFLKGSKELEAEKAFPDRFLVFLSKPDKP